MFRSFRLHLLLILLSLCWPATGRADVQDVPPFPFKDNAKTVLGKNTTPGPNDLKDFRASILTSPRISSVAVIGDSTLAKSNCVSGWGNDIVSQWMAKPNWKGRVSVSNKAQNSATAQGWAAVFTSQAEYLKRDYGLTIISLWINDISINRTATQIQTDLTAIFAAVRNSGSKVFFIIPPSTGSPTSPQLAVRATMISWAQGIGPLGSGLVDYLYDASWVTQSGTFDTIHPTVTTNGTIATDCDAQIPGGLFPDLYLPGPAYQGTVTVRRSGFSEVGLDFTMNPAAYDNDTDANHPRPPDIRGSRGEPYFPYGFPTGCGINVGIAGATQAMIPNTIDLGTGNFLIWAWLDLGVRHGQSANNHGPILSNDDASPDMFYIAGSGVTGSGNTCRPTLRIDGTDIGFPNLPFLQPGRPTFVAVRRVSNLIYMYVDGVWGTPVSNSGTITFNRAFWRNAGGASGQWLQSKVLAMGVKSGGTHSTREIENIMRGEAPWTSDGTLEAWWDFREGSGMPVDLSANHRVLNLASASEWSWLSPSGLPSRAVSTDNGDAGVTLSVATSAGTQYWATTLTADRTVTLSTTGAKNGARFRLTRATSATGSFSLNVGTGPLKALSAGQWCEVEYDGVWRLTASGSL